MPRLKFKKKGKRVNVWIPEYQLKTAMDIDNLSKFFQLALDQAAGIMTIAILRDKHPEKYKETRKVKDVIEPFNRKYPLNDLTRKRKEYGTDTQPGDESDSEESNPALL